MSSTVNNKSFKIIITLLSLMLLASLFYIYKMSSHSKGIIMGLRSEKVSLEYDLEKVKVALDSAIAKNGHLNQALIAERVKVEKMLAEIKSGNFNEQEVQQYKVNSKNLELRIAYLMNEINNYKKQIDSTTSELRVANTTKDTLKNRNEKLTRRLNEAGDRIAKASKLSYYNLEAKTFKKKSSGEQIFVDKASKVSVVKTSFIIGENELVAPQNKVLYIQVLAPDGTLIGGNQTTTTGEQIADYSAVATLFYENKSLRIEKEIPVEKLKPGTYQIKVFDEGREILNNTLTLK